jgi:hypothetical protein
MLPATAICFGFDFAFAITEEIPIKKFQIPIAGEIQSKVLFWNLGF